MSFSDKYHTGVNVYEDGQNDLKDIDLDALSNRDEVELAAMGKKQVLRRNFSLLNILGLALSCTITWEGMLMVFVYALTNGGPAGLVWGFVFCWLGYLAINASLAEMASMAPTAGGQYHWVYMLAPTHLKRFLSYVVGWQTVIAWQAGTASAAYLGGTIIQGLIIINYPDYDFQRWHGTLLVYAIMFICVFFNSVLGRFLPQVEYAILIFHLCGFLGILIPLAVLAPHGSAHDVFGLFLSQGGYSSDGLTFFVGIVSATFAFIGADGPVHMCEEIAGASKIVPWTMIGSILINGTLGFCMVIVVLFSIGDISTVLSAPVTVDTGYPFLQIFLTAVNSVKSATAMASFVVALVIFACVSFFAPTSRMTWSFARDRGLPGSRWIGHVDPKTKLPLWSIGLTALVTLLLALINIGSSIAFNAIVSLVVAGFLGSYMIPVGLLLWRRIFHPETLRWGPWRMGKIGIAVNILGLAWTLIAFIFSFFPVAIPVTSAAVMNWSCLLYGGTTIFFLLFYVTFGRLNYKGPIIETTVMEQLS